MDVRLRPLIRWFRDRLWAFVVLVFILFCCGSDDSAVAITPFTQQAQQAPKAGNSGEKPNEPLGQRLDAKPDLTQQPSPSNLSVPSVEGVLAPIPESSDIEARIRKALSSPEKGDATGDPILDGILEAVGRQGSVVRNSMFEGLLPKETATQPGHAEGNSQDLEFRPAVPVDPEHEEDQLCRVAEQLLATARLLSQLPGEPNGPRRRLIREMRREAARLLGPLELDPLEPRHRDDESYAPPGFIGTPHALPSGVPSGELIDPFSR